MRAPMGENAQWRLYTLLLPGCYHRAKYPSTPESKRLVEADGPFRYVRIGDLGRFWEGGHERGMLDLIKTDSSSETASACRLDSGAQPRSTVHADVTEQESSLDVFSR